MRHFLTACRASTPYSWTCEVSTESLEMNPGEEELMRIVHLRVMLAAVLLAMGSGQVKGQCLSVVTPSVPQPTNEFGTHVDLVGATLAVSAHRHNETGPLQGAVCIYDETPAGDWIESQMITVTPPANQFGAALSMNVEHLIVGAPDTTSNGQLYAFRRTGGQWQQEQLLLDPGVGMPRFGSSVDLDGDRMIVGQPAFRYCCATTGMGRAHIYEFDGVEWAQVQELLPPGIQPTDEVGDSVALCGDLAVIGATGVAFRRGAVFVFRNDGTDWLFEKRIDAPPTVPSFDRFGTQVQVEGDTILVSCPRFESSSGAVFAYRFNAGALDWELEQQIEVAGSNEFGRGIALDGSIAKILQSQAVHRFERIGGSWVETHRVDAPEFNRALASDGARTVGTRRPLSASVFEFGCFGPQFIRGDCNDNSVLDVADGVVMLIYLFAGGVVPSCLDACDTNDTGDVGLDDAILLLNYLFLSGPPPSAPFPNCGGDPTIDDILCYETVSCP